MIPLTRLNGHALLVNSDLIKHVEATPDTTLTLVTGDKLVVLEACDEVAERSLQYRAGLLHYAYRATDTALTAQSAHAAVKATL